MGYFTQKLELVSNILGLTVDILMVSETKIDDTFRESQVLIEGFSTPYRLDRRAMGRGSLLDIREDVPS